MLGFAPVPKNFKSQLLCRLSKSPFGWDYNNNNVHLSCAHMIILTQIQYSIRTVLATQFTITPPPPPPLTPLLYIGVVPNMSARHKKTLSLICIACVFANQKSLMHKLIIPQSMSELVDYGNTTTTQRALKTCVGNESVREGRRALYTIKTRHSISQSPKNTHHSISQPPWTSYIEQTQL